MLVAFHAIASPLEHVADRCIGREAQRFIADAIAYVIGAVGRRRLASPVAMHRGQPDTDPRCAGDGPDNANERHGAVHPARTFETRGKIGDFQHAAVLGLQTSHEDRRVAHVMLGGGNLPFQFEPPDTLVLPVAVEECAKGRIAIDPRDASPDETARLVDEGADLAIADGRQFERASYFHNSSHWWTAVTLPR